MLVWKIFLLKINKLHAQANVWKASLWSTRVMIHGAGAVHGRADCYPLLGK